jgi:hypothetical protein
VLVHPRSERFFLCELWRVDRKTWLTKGLGAIFVRLRLVDANAQEMEIHHFTQLERQNVKEVFRTAA